jgi:hypothetical protein
MATGGALKASDFDLGLMQLSASVITPSYANPTGAGNGLTITLGSGNSIVWNGTNDAGAIVTGGNYFIVIKSSIAGQTSQEVVRQVMVVNHGQSGLAGVILEPNPISLRLYNQAQFVVNITSAQVTATRVKIYSLAGELVQTLDNTPGNPSLVPWDLTKVNYASGTYIAVLELENNTAIIGRQTLKVVVVH